MCAEKKSELDTPSCGARRGRPFAALSPFRCQLQSACRCVTVAVQKSNQVDFLRVPPAARPACDPLTSPSQRAPRSGACARRWPRSCLSSLQSRAPPPKLRPRLLPRARLKEHLKLHQLVPRLMRDGNSIRSGGKRGILGPDGGSAALAVDMTAAVAKHGARSDASPPILCSERLALLVAHTRHSPAQPSPLIVTAAAVTRYPSCSCQPVRRGAPSAASPRPPPRHRAAPTSRGRS